MVSWGELQGESHLDCDRSHPSCQVTESWEGYTLWW